MVREYQASTNLRLDGQHLLVLPVTLIGGVLVGLLGFSIGYNLFSIGYNQLVALGMGYVGGLALGWLMQRWIITNLLFTVLAALLLSLTAYFTFHYAGYFAFVEERRTILIEEEAIAEDTTGADRFVQDLLLEETGSSGFVGYMKLKAKEGFYRPTSRYVCCRPPIHVSGMGVYLYWLLEFVLLASLPVGAAWDTMEIMVKAPHCDTCRQYFKQQHVGLVADENRSQFLQTLQQANYAQAGRMIELDDCAHPRLVLQLGRCRCENGDRLFTVREITGKREGELTTRVHFRLLLTPDQENSLLAATPEPA